MDLKFSENGFSVTDNISKISFEKERKTHVCGDPLRTKRYLVANLRKKIAKKEAEDGGNETA